MFILFSLKTKLYCFKVSIIAELNLSFFKKIDAFSKYNSTSSKLLFLKLSKTNNKYASKKSIFDPFEFCLITLIALEILFSKTKVVTYFAKNESCSSSKILDDSKNFNESEFCLFSNATTPEK